MGEYAYYEHRRIKIGTCEDMLYLRYDQTHLVTNAPNSLDPRRHPGHIRFRFPFPDEDRVQPGEFDDPFRALGLYGLEVPECAGHHDVQFASSNPRGHVVMLPCPESPEGKASGLRFVRNGYAGPVGIVQQRVWEGRLVTVLECGGCGSRFRLPELSDAEPVIAACRAKADGYAASHDSRSAQFWHTVADRIAAGYDLRVLAPETVPTTSA